MRNLSKFFRLSIADQSLLIKATILLAAVRLGVYALPFATVRKILSRAAVTRSTGREGAVVSTTESKRAIWAVETVGRRLPSIGTCLAQALVAHVLLARRGYQSNLRIGVTRNDGHFIAHAWLEKDGRVLIGGDGSTDYTPMPVLNGLGL